MSTSRPAEAPAATDGRRADVYVELDDVTKVFGEGAGAVAALGPVSFEIRRGEFLSVVGPSGCGKSTLLTLLSGLVPATTGAVRIDGRTLTRPYESCGIAFQSPVLLEWRTALDNVLLQFEMRGQNPGAHRERALELLDTLGLADAAHRYPRQLSGGMRQRVSLARALIHDPTLLLMDEPFSAVDALTREQLVADLQDVCVRRGANLTVLFITHDIDEAVFLGDRVLVMTPRPGRIAEMIDVVPPRPRDPRTFDSEHGHLGRTIRDVFVRTGVFRARAHGSEEART